VKIPSNSITSRAPGTGPTAPEAAAGKAPPAPAPRSGADTVAITSLSAQLQAIEQGLADVPVIDAGKVESIRQAIADGRFEVDAGVVADKLIASVREHLLGRNR
jgi:negative regulator of flagellin synthesis FlgM